jgi:cytochrome c oxidase cbb3-type subunit 3
VTAWRVALFCLSLSLSWPVRADDAATHELGRRVYNFRCYFCHGYSGDARTQAASFLNPSPRDFTSPAARGLTAPRIVAALREGRAGTAMASFAAVLSEAEMQAVAAFVEHEFVRDRAANSAYHTVANGWPDHVRYAAAFPFARGQIALDAPVESLDAGQLKGRRLFMASCVSCHDGTAKGDERTTWSARPLSYPRIGFVPGQVTKVDAVSSASVYALHEVTPKVAGLSTRERRGEALFQANCAFCHGADGTGKNWIGQFMQPKARDLTQFDRSGLPRARLVATVRDGLTGTSMPAWKSVLGAPDIDAVAAYVMRVFYRPARQVEPGPTACCPSSVTSR